MVQRVITTKVCDMCPDGDPSGEVEFSGEVTVGPVSRFLDLCGQDKEKLIGNLAEHLAEIGAPIKKTGQAVLSPNEGIPKRRNRGVGDNKSCVLCGGEKTYKSLKMHYTTKHQMTPEQVEEQSAQQPLASL